MGVPRPLQQPAYDLSYFNFDNLMQSLNSVFDFDLQADVAQNLQDFSYFGNLVIHYEHGFLQHLQSMSFKEGTVITKFCLQF